MASNLESVLDRRSLRRMAGARSLERGGYLASVRAMHKPKRNFMKLLDGVFAISR